MGASKGFRHGLAKFDATVSSKLDRSAKLTDASSITTGASAIGV